LNGDSHRLDFQPGGFAEPVDGVFGAQYAVWPNTPSIPAIELTLTMRPLVAVT
jgi:hypothetical protein